MKSSILLLSLFVALGLQSCQSEYGERMSKAMRLKAEYQKVRSTMDHSENPVLQFQLSKIEKEIRFQATLSGNESHFLQEIWNN